jgi:hypothetical protein
MFSTLRNRFGIPGVISVMALIFAMFGGAYAASNSSGGGKATASAKAKKGPRGPKGAPGAPGQAGPAGPAGPQGPAGAKGDTGAAGSNGSPGTPGTPGAAGQSVTSEPEPPGPINCANGGVKFTIGTTKTYACNGPPGVPGAQGADGDDSPFAESGGTLPTGTTLTGVWALANGAEDSTDISFGIPLAAPLAGSAVHGVPAGGPVPAACDDGVAPPPSVGNPEADSGHLCVFVGNPYGGFGPGPLQPPSIVPPDGNLETGASGATRSGSLLLGGGPAGPGGGSWAVTG